MNNQITLSTNQQAIVEAVAAGNNTVANVSKATKLPHTTVSANIFPLSTKGVITAEQSENGTVLALSKNTTSAAVSKPTRAASTKTAKPKAKAKTKTKAKAKAKNNDGLSKVDVATNIFVKMSKKGAARKEIIEAFVADADLTVAGAKTYYFNINKKLNG